MDTNSVNDRTAAWQAAIVYSEVYEIRNPDNALEEVRSAFERWQEANQRLYERSWVWDIDVAASAAESALNEMLRPSRTSASLRKKRERWTRARQHAADLQAEYLEAQERARTAREEYVRVLDQHY